VAKRKEVYIDDLEEDNFDADELIEERAKVSDEVEVEFEKDKSVRARSLLLTNYVDNQLKDCIVMMTRSKKARGISRKVVIEILYERGYVYDLIYQDLIRVNRIRDLFGHTMRMSKIEDEVKKIIASTDVSHALRIQVPNWENLSVSEKVQHVALRMLIDLDKIFLLIALDTSPESIIDPEAIKEMEGENKEMQEKMDKESKE